jgi:hypothetical protein
MLRPFSAFVLLVVASGALPLAAQNAGLKPDALKALKSATVFIKVGAKGYNFSGSGFVVQAGKDYGYIVTNQHVVEPQLEKGSVVFGGFGMVRGLVFNVDVVFESGAPTEWSTRAEIIYADPLADLALLKVKAVRPLPKPLELKGADRLPETTPVYVCGFPFGDALAASKRNPEHSIGIGSVASNRFDNAGELAAVQINGALNPGNSGGPVVSADGKLVGVAVSSVLGAGIGFAIPPVKVRTVVDDIHVGLPKLALAPGDASALRITIPFADPADRLRTLTAHVAPAPDRRFSGRVADMDGAIELKLVYHSEDQTYRAEIPQPKGTHLWYQASIEPKTGRKKTTAPVRIAVRASTGGTTEISPTWRDPGYYGIKSVQGFPLPPVATLLGPTPEGSIDAEILNRTADANVGKTFTTDVLLVALLHTHIPGEFELRACDGDGLFLGGLKFMIDKALHSRLRDAGVNDCRLALRLKGSVQWAPTAKQKQFVVEEVSLIELDGNTATTFKREKKAKIYVAPQPGLSTPVDEEAERKFDETFRTKPHSAVSGSYQRLLIVAEVKDEVIRDEGKPQTLKNLVVKNLLGEPLTSIRLLARPELGVNIEKLLARKPAEGVPGQITFRPICLDGRTVVCAVSDFIQHDGHTAGAHFKSEPPVFKQIGVPEPDIQQKLRYKQELLYQNTEVRSVSNAPHNHIDKEQKWKVLINAIDPAQVETNAGTIGVSRWSLTDLDGKALEMKFYSKPELAAKVLARMKESESKPFRGFIHFKVLRIDKDKKAECAINIVEELDQYGGKLRWMEGDVFPDIPVEKVGAIPPLPPRPLGAKPEQIVAEPSDTEWVVGAFIVALLCAIGVAIAALLRKGSGGSNAPRRAEWAERPSRRRVERRREVDDPDVPDDDDRPRRRRRRD